MKRRINAALMAGATFLGLSSAPMLCLGLQGGMLTWEYVTRSIKSRMSLTLAGIAAVYVAMSPSRTARPSPSSRLA